MKLKVGTNAANSEPVFFDIQSLIITRLLICANSGGGKSYLIRRIVELLCKMMPVVIFDPEGEFASLREKFDFLLVGPNGETPADCRSAKLVMQKVLELQISCIFDLSELEKDEKHLYVKLACQAAIDSRKELWRETAFIFDEAHEFCPESGKGQSVAKSAVLAFPTKGRKRRFLSIFATQRLHKLALDARAEMLNRMVGMTFELDDLEDAAKLLGIPRDKRDDFNRNMRSMAPGTFYTFGRAVSLETIQVKVGPVETSHEIQSSKNGVFTPPPTSRIKKLLPSLADLPKQAVEEDRNIESLQAHVRELERKLDARPEAKPVAPERIEVPALTESERKRITALIDKVDRFTDAVNRASNQLGKIQTEKDGIRDEAADLKKLLEGKLRPGGFVTVPVKLPDMHARKDIPWATLAANEKPRNMHGLKPEYTEGDIGKGAREVLTAIAQGSDGASDEQIAVLTGYKSTSRKEFKRQLKELGFIQEGGRGFTVTQAGRDALGTSFRPLPTGKELLQHWQGRLTGGELVIFETHVVSYPNPITVEMIMQQGSYKQTSVKEFRRKLIARELLVGQSGSYKANPLLFQQ